MHLKDLFQKWKLTDLHIEASVLDIPYTPSEEDKNACWDLCVELLMFLKQQWYPYGDGVGHFIQGKELMFDYWDVDNATFFQNFIDRVVALETATGKLLQQHGRKVPCFVKISDIFLNYVVQPFLGHLNIPGHEHVREGFDEHLDECVDRVRRYAKLLADVADVKDLVEIETPKYYRDRYETWPTNTQHKEVD